MSSRCHRLIENNLCVCVCVCVCVGVERVYLDERVLVLVQVYILASEFVSTSVYLDVSASVYLDVRASMCFQSLLYVCLSVC